MSFDIDGLSFDNCPHTGTPVCGGLSFNKAVYLVDTLVRSGRRIIGFDVVEGLPRVRRPDRRHHRGPHPVETLRADAQIERKTK